MFFFFLFAATKHRYQQLKEGRAYSDSKFKDLCREPWQQGLEAAGHSASMVGKQRERGAYYSAHSLLYMSSGPQSMRCCYPHLALSTSINTI